MENLSKAEKLLQALESYGAVSKEEQMQFMQDVAKVLQSFKEQNTKINQDTTDKIDSLVSKVSQEVEKAIDYVKDSNEKTQSKTEKQLKDAIEECKKLADEIKSIEVKDGKDADEEKIKQEILSEIVIPEYKEVTAVEVRDKLESLDGDERLDIQAIKGIKEFFDTIKSKGAKQFHTVMSFGGLFDTSIVNPTNGQVPVWNSTTQRWENGTVSGSGITLETNNTPNGSQSLLNLKQGTNVTITDDGLGGITINSTGSGSGDVTGPASSGNNNVALFNGTTGKVIKDSGLTLSGANTGDQNLFQTIAVSGQSNVVADTTSDTLTLANGANIEITTNATTDTVTVKAVPSGSGINNEFQINTGGSFSSVGTYTHEASNVERITFPINHFSMSDPQPGGGTTTFFLPVGSSQDLQVPSSSGTLALLSDITGTVTDVSVDSANGFAGSVATSTSTPVITLSTTITGLVKADGTALSAAVANTDYQSPIILTTTGTSGAATFNGTTLNIPDYTSGGGTPGGSDTQLQYNNAGSFGGISGATTNGTAVTYTTGNLIGADVKASSSAGLQILSNAGTVTALFGAGGGANSTLYGGTKLDYATASTVPYLDASKNLISSAVTPTELDYVSGVTSSIQTQIGTKVTGPASATDNAVVRFDNTTGKLVQDSAVTIADTSGDITGGKYNKVTITAPATGSTLTIADGQTLTVNGSATITNGTHSGTNTGDQTASTLAIAKLSTPAVDTVQEYLDSTGSSGYFSGGEITNGAAGTVNIAAGAGFIRATNSTTAQLLSFEWSAFSNVAIASDTTKYIYISYNGGSPTYVLSATATDEDPTKILVGIATNEGGTIVATLNAGVRLDESIGDAGRYLRRVFGFVRDSSVGGLIVSGTGTRNIALSAGTLWYGRTMYNISAIDTSGAGTFATYYRNGSGGFTKTSSVTQWNNTQYDNGTGTLATLAANKWAVAWLYVSADGLFYYVYGRASHTSQAAAETEALPATLPNVITAGTLLVGRLIFQKSASTATFYSAFTNTFSNTGVTLHNDLGSIQGGTTGEYYHLTSAEYTGTGTGNFVRATSPTLTTPAIGTPSSGTLTNCTGLPVAGITASTSTALGVGSIELGNASDTTISRSSAGIISVEGEVMNGYATTATAAGTTTLTITSAKTQYFTGTSTQTVKLPTTSVILGQSYTISNQSTGTVTVQSSGANTIQILGAGMTATFVANTATPTTAAHWNYSMNEYVGLNNAITASSNAATINLAYKTNTVTNNSAATLTITLPTAGAIDGEMRVVRVLDFSAVAQTLAWVNTEDSTVTAPTTSNGSTTLPLTVGFMYNNTTSKWRTIAKA